MWHGCLPPGAQPIYSMVADRASWELRCFLGLETGAMPGTKKKPRASMSCYSPASCPMRGLALAHFSILVSIRPAALPLWQPWWWPCPDCPSPSSRDLKWDGGSLTEPPPCARPLALTWTLQDGGHSDWHEGDKEEQGQQRGAFPLMRLFSFGAGWCETLSCGSSSVKQEVLDTCDGATASAALGGLK